MPIYNYFCDNCKKDVSKLLDYKRSKEEQKCKDCGSVLVRNPSMPHTVTKEVIDNGVMIRRAEQYADSAELIEEREHLSRQNKNKKGL